MSISDLIADQLTVIRNAIRGGKMTVTIKRSGVLEGIMDIIKREGFIENYRVIEDSKQGQIKVYLKYLDDGTPVMEAVKRVSTPGLRHYVPAKKVRDVLGGVGISIFSTSKGLLTDKEVKEKGIGGELICQIW